MQFKEVLTENKVRKHLRGSGEIAKEKERPKEYGGQMKRQVEVIQELKTGRLLTEQILKVLIFV